jgi:hypothetical protein
MTGSNEIEPGTIRGPGRHTEASRACAGTHSPVAAHQKLLLLPFGLGVEGLEPRRFFAAQRFFHQAAELLPEAEDIGLYLARSVDDWERVEKGALPGQAGKLIIVHMVGRRSLFEFICEFQDYVPILQNYVSSPRPAPPSPGANGGVGSNRRVSRTHPKHTHPLTAPN